MTSTDSPRNEPTWLEYLIVYIALGLTGFFLYRTVLAPNGYTFSAGWAALRGKAKPAAAAPAPDMKPANENAEKVVPEMKPEEDMQPEKTADMGIAPPAPMPAAANPAEKAPAAPMPLSEEDD